MSVFFIKFFSSYLLMPLLAIVFGFIAFLIAKKNKLLKNKKLVFYVLLASVLLCIPALLGFIDYWFMPYIYILLAIGYAILGWYNIKFIHKYLPKKEGEEKRPYFPDFFISFLIMFIGAALFSLIFNLCNELKYGLWACTCLLPFIFLSVYAKTYESYLSIPLEIYKVWKFSNSEDLSSFELMDYNKLLVMELEVFKQVEDSSPSKIKAKAPANMSFGTWFQKFLVDYNIKFPLTPVDVRDEKEVYGWIFYVKRSFFHRRRYIDYEMSIEQNKIREKYVIIAKRVSEQFDEKGVETQTVIEDSIIN